jgi:ArsR family transcriptional regulator
MEIETAVTRLAALAQGSRLAIFRLLVQHGPAGLPAGEIAAQLGIANSALSFHLKELTHAGLLSARQDGRYIYYAPDFAAMNGLLGYLTENCCGGQPCDDTCAPAPPSRSRARTPKPAGH